MIVAGLVLLLQAAATVGRQTNARVQPVPAPPESVVVRTPARTTTLRLVNTAGVVGVDAGKLAAALGGTFKLTSPSHYSLTVGDSHISFTDAVPFAGDDSTIVPLTSPPRVVGRNVILPFFVVTELVPRFFSDYMYDQDLHEVRQFNSAARRVQAPATAPPSRARRPAGASGVSDRSSAAIHHFESVSAVNAARQRKSWAKQPCTMASSTLTRSTRMPPSVPCTQTAANSPRTSQRTHRRDSRVRQKMPTVAMRASDAKPTAK